ncbi:ATPase [Candidatus Woesearchaeota archaeon B3_Woes]|nr:MAG: ATPase [Candidatus Woesearchaeota archaeon B3_Woes]
MPDYHTKSIEETLKNLETKDKGLTQEEANKRLIRYGPNEIKDTEQISPLNIFISQFKSFLVAILFIAVIVSLIIDHKIDAFVIAIILILNAILGFVQEYKAEKSIQALKKLASQQSVVLRDGKEKKINSTELVPGDIIILETGEKIPADSRLIESINLHTQEASLTGESTPVTKDIKTLNKKSPVADRKNIVFSGTIITAGRGKAAVIRTGMDTEIGKIAKMIQKQTTKLTPLQIKLKKLGELLGLATIIICFLVFFTGILAGIDTITMFITAISLAVAAIPEGLPAVVTISLALGTQRMVKRNALIRKLPSVETLGSTTVICTDKTGTLTLNQMTVRKLFINDKTITVTGRGYESKGEFYHNKEKINIKEIELLLTAGTLCNNAKFVNRDIIGDPTEGSLVVSAAKAELLKEKLEEQYPRIDEIEFTSERKRMSTLHNIKGTKTIYSKGAPDVLLNYCNRVYKNGKIKKLTQEEKEKILQINETFAKQALRVLGFAFKPSNKLEEKNLIFIGLQAMIDPPREEVKTAIEKCKQAGIKVVMITGDFKVTAEAIGRELGITGQAIDGAELDNIQNLKEHVENISIYARVNPSHKVKILEALKENKHIVAMTGDGVNDAPAIKKADIGISMGITGTDVAKEASDMILIDDNFASIVNAVEEGRGIYDNIKKFVQYLLSSNIGEILTIFVALIMAPFFANALPLIALQILWINLVTDGLPALALGVDPTEPHIMRKKPRNPKENIINKSRAIKMIFIGIIMMVGTLGIFKIYNPNINLVYAQTIAFTTLVMFQMFNVLNLRSDQHSLFKIGIFSNMKLIIAIIISIALQLLVVYSPFMQNLFSTTTLYLKDWIYILLVSSSVLIFGEIIKIFNKLIKKRKRISPIP